VSKKIYDKNFYEDRSDSVRSAKKIVPYLLEITNAKSVVDIGCGNGAFLSIFEKNGIEDYLGVDGKWVDEKYLRIPSAKFLSADFERPFEMDKVFDLAISLEVAEHISKEKAEDFIKSIVKLAPFVLFSAAIPYQGGTYHVNEQWPEYWADLFAKQGYIPIDCLREKYWNDDDVSYWYSQNMILYVKKDLLSKQQNLKKLYEESNRGILSFVHPTHFLQKAKIWNMVWKMVPEFVKIIITKKSRKNM